MRESTARSTAEDRPQAPKRYFMGGVLVPNELAYATAYRTRVHHLVRRANNINQAMLPKPYRPKTRTSCSPPACTSSASRRFVSARAAGDGRYQVSPARQQHTLQANHSQRLVLPLAVPASRTRAA